MFAALCDSAGRIVSTINFSGNSRSWRRSSSMRKIKDYLFKYLSCFHDRSKTRARIMNARQAPAITIFFKGLDERTGTTAEDAADIGSVTSLTSTGAVSITAGTELFSAIPTTKYLKPGVTD